MNYKKVFGWNDEMMNRIAHVARNARESTKHLMFGMRVTTGVFEDLFIQVMDDPGRTQKILTRSEPFENREAMIEAYDHLVHKFNVTHCCMMHKEELHPDDEQFDSLFDDDPSFDSLFEEAGSDEMDSLFDDDTVDTLFDDAPAPVQKLKRQFRDDLDALFD